MNWGEPLACPAQERFAAVLSRAMARRDQALMDAVLDCAHRQWGVEGAAAIDARAQELLAEAEEALADEIRVDAFIDAQKGV